MTDLVIAPIVEGYGEVEAVPLLLRRIWLELLSGTNITVLPPIRQSRGKLVAEDGEPRLGLQKAVELARLKLANHSGTRVVLVLIDSEGQCPKSMAPALSEFMKPAPATIPQCVVLAHVMFETWFCSSCTSLANYLQLSNEDPALAELKGWGKGWVIQRFKDGTYSETVDQPAMAAEMDLMLALQNSPSFEKLYRELCRWRLAG